MRRTLLAIIMSALAADGMSLAHHDEHGKSGDYVKLLSQKDIIEKLDGKNAARAVGSGWKESRGFGPRRPKRTAWSSGSSRRAGRGT